MESVSIVGLDLAKNVFQAHGASPSGAFAFSKKITRGKLLPFFAGLRRCLVAMEACAGPGLTAGLGRSPSLGTTSA